MITSMLLDKRKSKRKVKLLIKESQWEEGGGRERVGG
jgi:hypothetical protein